MNHFEKEIEAEMGARFDEGFSLGAEGEQEKLAELQRKAAAYDRLVEWLDECGADDHLKLPIESWPFFYVWEIREVLEDKSDADR